MQKQRSPNTSIALESITDYTIIQSNFNDMKDSSGSPQQTLSTFRVPGTVGKMISRIETFQAGFSPGRVFSRALDFHGKWFC